MKKESVLILSASVIRRKINKNQRTLKKIKLGYNICIGKRLKEPPTLQAFLNFPILAKIKSAMIIKKISHSAFSVTMNFACFSPHDLSFSS